MEFWLKASSIMMLVIAGELGIGLVVYIVNSMD